jgi:hypothetical protein
MVEQQEWANFGRPVPTQWTAATRNYRSLANGRATG